MKNHAIYGDDDQEKLQNLFDQEEEIQKLVDISNRQLMKKRLKEGEKKKAVIDTTTNAVKPEEFPEDLVEEAKPEKKKKKEKEPKKKKEKKTLNTNGVKNVIKIFILLILVLVVYQFRTEIIGFGKTIGNKIVSLIPSSEEKVQEPVDVSDNEDAQGYLDSSSNKDYDLYDVLDVTTKANGALQNYYKNLVQIANDSKTTSVATAIATNAEMVEKDKASLASYKDKFSKFDKGTEYYDSLMFRFDKLQGLIEEISWVDESKVYAYINKEISEENNRIIEGKNCFMSFLDANGVQYTVNDNNITYETN